MDLEYLLGGIMYMEERIKLFEVFLLREKCWYFKPDMTLHGGFIDGEKVFWENRKGEESKDYNNLEQLLLDEDCMFYFQDWLREANIN